MKILSNANSRNLLKNIKKNPNKKERKNIKIGNSNSEIFTNINHISTLFMYLHIYVSQIHIIMYIRIFKELKKYFY